MAFLRVSCFLLMIMLNLQSEGLYGRYGTFAALPPHPAVTTIGREAAGGEGCLKDGTILFRRNWVFPRAAA